MSTFSTGQAVVYTSGQGRPLNGVNEAQVYYVVLVESSDSKIQLVETFNGAFEDEPEFLKISADNATGDTHAVAAAIENFLCQINQPFGLLRRTQGRIIRIAGG